MGQRKHESREEYLLRRKAEYQKYKPNHAAYEKKYRQANKEKIDKQKAVRRNTPEGKAYALRKGKEWKLLHPERVRESSFNGWRKNKVRILARNKEIRDALRLEMIAAYGGSCTCCGETTPEFLTVDHVNNDGNRERWSETGARIGGAALYRRLRKAGWPTDRYQLLCFNCNCAKGFFGVCPHQRVVLSLVKVA